MNSKLREADLLIILILFILSTLGCDKRRVPPKPASPDESIQEPTQALPKATTLGEAGFTAEMQLDAVLKTVRVINRERRAYGDGSGVMVERRDGRILIVTADHVLDDAVAVDVHAFTPATFPKRTFVFRDVEIVHRSPARDLALLSIEDRADLTIGPIGQNVPNREYPTPVMTVGCGDGKAPSALLNHIIGCPTIRRPNAKHAVRMWELDQIEIPGRSGGPMLDVDGNLIGISSGTSGEHAYYCHLDEIVAELKESEN